MEDEATLAMLLNTYWVLRSRGIPATLTSASFKGGMRTTLEAQNSSQRRRQRDLAQMESIECRDEGHSMVALNLNMD